KYIAKAEPSYILNIFKNDSLKEHIIAQRIGYMELIFLLLGHQICKSSAIIKFLTTEPSPTRTHS
ncbi:43133_t:CDS:1, partial [Gigaspora margarita]